MRITLKRIYSNDTYTIGHIYINGEYICDSIEDTDRCLDSSMDVDYIKQKKVYAKTAIPTGIYNITLNVVSPKFAKKAYYKAFCQGKLPRILNVKGFDGILMHRGSTEKDSAGCIILGYNTIKGKVTNSKKAFELLYNKIRNCGKITIEITRTYYCNK